MLKPLPSNNRTAFDIVNIVAGLGLLISPWLLGFTAEGIVNLTKRGWRCGMKGHDSP